MSNRSLSRSQYPDVPKLNKYNYYEWAMKIKIHLFGLGVEHWRILKGSKQADGTYAEPAAPTDEMELYEWNRSERMAYDLIVATAGHFHAELMLRHKGKPYKIWQAVKEHHKQYDGLLRRQAWVEAITIRQKPNEMCTDFFDRTKNLFSKIQRLTPENQTIEECIQEIALCAILAGLPEHLSLRRTLLAQDDLSWEDARSAFYRADADERMGIKSVNARCYMCDEPGHGARDCPHRDAVIQLVNQRISNSARTNGGNNNRRRRRGNGTKTNTSSTPGTRNTKA